MRLGRKAANFGAVVLPVSFYSETRLPAMWQLTLHANAAGNFALERSVNSHELERAETLGFRNN
jgi:hypothetical protein